jgi:hypothetical protein
MLVGLDAYVGSWQATCGLSGWHYDVGVTVIVRSVGVANLPAAYRRHVLSIQYSTSSLLNALCVLCLFGLCRCVQASVHFWDIFFRSAYRDTT